MNCGLQEEEKNKIIFELKQKTTSCISVTKASSFSTHFLVGTRVETDINMCRN